MRRKSIKVIDVIEKNLYKKIIMEMDREIKIIQIFLYE